MPNVHKMVNKYQYHMEGTNMYFYLVTISTGKKLLIN